MVWIVVASCLLFAIFLWWCWIHDDSSPTSDCGVSLLDWFDLS
jgi:hypothetical protein